MATPSSASFLVVVLLPLLVATSYFFLTASACALAIGSCDTKSCAALSSITSGVSGVSAQYAFPYFQGNPYNTGSVQLGFFQGIANNNSATSVNSSRGGAYVNWEVFPYIGTGPEAGFLLSYFNETSLPACCNRCAQTAGCSMYQWFGSNNLSTIYGINRYQGKVGSSGGQLKWPQGHVDGFNCYLLTGGSVNESARYGFPEGWLITSPFAPIHTQQISSSNYTNIAPSWVGGHCNPTSSVTGDPHFVGARGTKFEFNGAIDKTFALISDEKLQLNMKLEGYEDSRIEEAPLVKNGKAIRTWIRELGFVWLHNGKRHTLHLKCRKGPQQEIGSGYLSSIVLDGFETKLIALNDLKRHDLSPEVHLERLGVEKKGFFDVETFQLALGDALHMKLDLRPAHPLLQTKEDSYVHFSIVVDKFHATGNVHGVLGQTFRQSSTQVARALEYKLLAQLMRKPISADSDSGKGFLDGAPEDYLVNDLLSTNFKFSSFMK